MKTLFRILSFAKPIQPAAFLFFLSSLLSTVFGLVNFTLLVPLLDVLFNNLNESQLQKMLIAPNFSWTSTYFIDLFYHYFAQMIQQYGKMGALQFVCIIIVFSVLLKNIFYYISMLLREALRANVIRNIRRNLFDKILALQLGYFSNQRKGDLISRMTSDVNELENTTVFSMDLLLRDPLALIAFFAILFSISVQMTLFTILIVPVSGGLIALISRKLRRKASQSQKSIANIVSILEEALGSLRIIKGYNADKYINNKFNQENNQYARYLQSMARTRELSSPFSEFAGVAVVVFILLYGGSLIFANNASLSASMFIAYIVIFSQILTPAKAIATSIGNIQRGLSAGERIFEILDTPIQINQKPNAIPLKSFEKQIEFRNVSFKYENKWVLKNINFTLQKGKTLALVGETGSGKSTIADLIPRFYDVQEGEVLIDGINLKDADLQSVIAQMGIVTQEAILFNDTIFNNIAFNAQNISIEQVEQAARIANAHDFILQTENGYQTVIGDRGVKLSGGQRQRITIARAILKNPPILILDEATSALDTESEKLVQDALNKLMENRTTLVIAHRLSTIQNADTILVLKDGEIVEQGTHQTLLKNESGYYRRLSMMQVKNE